MNASISTSGKIRLPGAVSTCGFVSPGKRKNENATENVISGAKSPIGSASNSVPRSSKHHRGAVISLVERKSQFTLLGKVRQKTAEAVQQQMVQRLRPHRHRVHTLTTDNGREFADHETLARKLRTRVYFADPYCAWQRGLNENINGLIRQYLPKRTDLRDVTEEELEFIMDRLNHRPRKTLGFKTPYELFLNHSRWKPIRVALES